MKKRPRIYYSARQRALIWERWRKGETLHPIARLFDRYHSSIQRIVAESGGIRPTERRRSRSALTLIEREEISRGVVAGKSMRAIAATLARAPSTISREIRRMRMRKAIEPAKRMERRGIEAVARRSVNFCRTERWPTWWHISCAWSGRLSRLRLVAACPP